MIARIWRGRVPATKADAYLDDLLATGLKKDAATPGDRGVRALQRIDGDTESLPPTCTSHLAS